MNIPDHIKDPERILWGLCILAIVLWASTDPDWSWFGFFISVCLILTTGGIGFLVGKEAGRSQGYAEGYLNCSNEKQRRR